MPVDYSIKPATPRMIDHACKNFHYSQSIPCGRKVAFAIFEEGAFIGVIIYSLGANNNLAKSFHMEQGDVVELTRIALKKHRNFVSLYIARTLKDLKLISPRVQIVVSYADIDHQAHAGAVYQATNWLYLGVSHTTDTQYFYNGKWTHERSINAVEDRVKRDTLKRSLPKRDNSDKHKYIFCFDRKLRKHYAKQSRPYPKAGEMTCHATVLRT